MVARHPLNPFGPGEPDAFCHRWKLRELSLFGSYARGEAASTSDIDLLYDFQPGAQWGLLDLAAMQEELEKMLARRVDLVSREGIERSANWLRKRAILSSVLPLYAA